MNRTESPLFNPFTLGKLALRNRIVMSPMTRSFSPLGVPGQDVADYYQRRANAGVGLIMTEGVGVDHPSAIGGGPGALGEENIPMMFGEAALAGWKKVVDDVHAAGGLIMPQLWHMGLMRTPETGLYKSAPSMRPSGIWGPEDKALLPEEYLNIQRAPTPAMTESDIADVIAAYARSAANAKAVGFDGIAIHAAHGYLIDSFFWDKTNERTDRWGGDLLRRVQFGVEVVAAIRKAVGTDLPISMRWSQWKQQDYDAKIAQTPQELEILLGALADAGVDLFDTSTRIYSKPAFDNSPMTLAGWARKLTGKPTMAVGGIGLSKDLQSSFAGGTVAIDNLDETEKLFEQGEFDLLGVGRSLLIDPEWIKKAQANQPFKPFSLEHYETLY
jgi:2,4-dienoyl-CoA reductase-like NADH-dependent reductase (Old Yellow Enzyme family)